mmetsp:Transcript_11884/g.36188  ORF Transcript_11884/g.36188 Transcript_11884/m.36188 type:complete len:320 (+) Transcript_11884:222-1181(+)
MRRGCGHRRRAGATRQCCATTTCTCWAAGTVAWPSTTSIGSTCTSTAGRGSVSAPVFSRATLPAPPQWRAHASCTCAAAATSRAVSTTICSPTTSRIVAAPPDRATHVECSVAPPRRPPRTPTWPTCSDCWATPSTPTSCFASRLCPAPLPPPPTSSCTHTATSSSFAVRVSTQSCAPANSVCSTPMLPPLSGITPTVVSPPRPRSPSRKMAAARRPLPTPTSRRTGKGRPRWRWKWTMRRSRASRSKCCKLGSTAGCCACTCPSWTPLCSAVCCTGPTLGRHTLRPDRRAHCCAWRTATTRTRSRLSAPACYRATFVR